MNKIRDARADDPYAFSKFSPIASAVVLAENGDLASGGRHVTGEGLQKGGLAGAIGAKDDPMLARIHYPVDSLENADAGAVYRKIPDTEKRTHREWQYCCLSTNAETSQ